MRNSKEAKKLRGCGVYIFDDSGERVLLAQRGPAARHEQYKWEGPGGQVDEGETYEDAAATYGVAVGTLKSRVNRARTQLAAMLQMENRHDLGPDGMLLAALQQSRGAAAI